MIILDKYQITSDPMNVILEERHIIKEGENAGQERWEVVGYYSSIGNLLRNLVDHDINTLGFEDLQAVAKRQLDLFFAIKELEETLKTHAVMARSPKGQRKVANPTNGSKKE